jgi:hypothetical protein
MKRVIESVIAGALFLIGFAAMVYFSSAGMVVVSVTGGLLMVGAMVVLLYNHGGSLRGLFDPGPRTDNLKIRGTARERAFIRVQNTINNKKVFVSVEEDGIYIRLAGDENNGEAFNENKVKVYDYNV